MQLSLRTDRHLLRSAASSTRYLMISLSAPVAAPRDGRLPVNVALILDRSGSMDGERKFELAREAVEQSLRMLRPEDRFTLVVYDTEVDTLVASTFATAEAKRLALTKLAEVGPRGGTDLHAGWTAGAAELAGRLSELWVSRALLITDGLANAGLTDHHALATLASELRRTGIATSTFGVGGDFDERLLRDIAHEGGGNFYFIQTPTQIPDLLTSELGEALEVVARDVSLRLVLPEGVRTEPLNRNRFSPAAGDNALAVELGDLTSGQEIQIVMRVSFPRGTSGRRTSISVRLMVGETMLEGSMCALEWRYATHAENDSQPRDRMVDREVARLYAARARAEATEANREGDFTRARRVLERTSARIAAYAGRDAELVQLSLDLKSEVHRFAETTMSAMELKSSFFVAESAGKNRGSDGRARRGPPR